MARLGGFHLEGGIDKTMLDLVRPVNSLYLTVGSEDPNTVFGGTWVKLTGGVLACAGTAGYAAAGAVGGSKKVAHPFGNKVCHDHVEGERGRQRELRPFRRCRRFAIHVRRMDERNRGGRTTTRSTSPSTSGRGRRSAGVVA